MKEGSILILKIMRNVIFICTIFASPVSGIAASALVSSSYSEIITDLPDSSGRRDFYLASGLAFQSPSEDQGHFVSWDFVGQNLEGAAAWLNSLPRELGHFVTSNDALTGVGSIKGEMVVMSDRAIVLLSGSDPSFSTCRLNLLPVSGSAVRTLLEGELFGEGMDTTEIMGRRERAVLRSTASGDEAQVRFFYSGTLGLEGAEWVAFIQSITSDRLLLSLAGQDGIFQDIAFQSIPEPSACGLILAAFAFTGRRRLIRTVSSQSPPA